MQAIKSISFCPFILASESEQYNPVSHLTVWSLSKPQMCLHWLTQCFWNYLDWTEICHYISTCIVLGPDYQVYVCVAVFKHLQPDILQRTQSQELQVFLKVRSNIQIQL